MNLQVLVATMHQKDLSLLEKMNIRCSAVIANQADGQELLCQSTPYGEVKMITTATRGVGLNRNLALLLAQGDILLFADDDVVYDDGMPQAVLEAFEKLPEADVIVFGLNMTKNGAITETRRVKTGRLRVYNSMRYGTCRMAVRREALLRGNISFHQMFGGGCPFSAGEDSLFLKNCFDRGLKVYGYDYQLGSCCKDSSTWFVGYNEKYFYDKGVLVRKLFPKSAYLMAFYFGAFFKRETQVSLLKRLSLVYAGVRGGKKMIPYGKDQ